MKRVAIFLSIFTNFLIALNNDKLNFKNLNFRFIGPDGNRAIAISGVSSDHNTYYVGAASGGLFKTTNKGISWEPVAAHVSRPLGVRHRRDSPGSRNRHFKQTSQGHFLQ